MLSIFTWRLRDLRSENLNTLVDSDPSAGTRTVSAAGTVTSCNALSITICFLKFSSPSQHHNFRLVIKYLYCYVNIEKGKLWEV